MLFILFEKELPAKMQINMRFNNVKVFFQQKIK